MASRDTPPFDHRTSPTPTGDVHAIESQIEAVLRADPRDDDGRTVTENGALVEPDRRQVPPPAEQDPGPQIVTADTVRSAPLGRPVFLVLLASLAATALVLMGLLWAFAR